jgi:uncharacterized protein
MDAVLSRFRSEYAMNNLEEIDGFFAALICSLEIAKPSQYLPEIWGGEMADDEAFDDRQELQDFLSLLMRHWNSIVHVLDEEDVFIPLLFEDEEGAARGNDWARGFMRGTLLIPILALAYEHDPDPEMRPYKDTIDAERREKLILGVAAGLTAIYRYFAPQRRRMAARARCRREGISPRRAKNRTQRSLRLRFGEEVQTLLR